MRRSLTTRLFGTVQLTRLAMAVGAVGDVWFTVLFTRESGIYPYLSVTKMPLWVALGLSAIIATGLFTFGASLNDLLDARHDSTFSPDKPIPSGRIRPGTAGILITSALLAALIAALPFGTWALAFALMVALGILFYNVAGKHVPAIGVVAIGLVSAMHMLIPNYELTFTFPVWLTMTHAMVISLSVHLIGRKRPALSRRSFTIIGVAYLTWSVIILMTGWYQGHEIGWWPLTSWSGIMWPILAVASFIWISRIKIARGEPRQATEKLTRYGAMWQSLYAASWLLAAGMYGAAMLLLGLAFTGFLAMTTMKELGGLAAHPPRYKV